MELGTLTAEILGQTLWLPKRGIGTFVTMELGMPVLDIREATADKPSISERLKRRRVTVVGQYHLWIQADDWSLHCVDMSILQSSDNDEIDRAMAVIDGQKIISIRHNGARSEINFEYGETM